MSQKTNDYKAKDEFFVFAVKHFHFAIFILLVDCKMEMVPLVCAGVDAF